MYLACFRLFFHCLQFHYVSQLFLSSILLANYVVSTPMCQLNSEQIDEVTVSPKMQT